MKNSVQKFIYIDCFKAIIPSVLIYSVVDIFSGILTVYTSTILGNFADSIFVFDFSYGISNFLKLIICLASSILFIPLISMLSEVFMFSNSLKHDRLVYRRFLDKTYISALQLDEGEIQCRLEQDTVDFRAYWGNICMKIIALPLVALYLLHNALSISIIFTFIIVTVSLIKLFVPIIIKNIQAKYDDEKRKYASSVRTIETEITRKPHIIKLYGLSEQLIKKIDDLYKIHYQNTIKKSVTYNSISSNILSFLNTFCTIIILFLGAVLVSYGDISTGEIVTMTGFFSVVNSMIGDISYIIKKIPILKKLTKRIILLYDDCEKPDGKSIDSFSNIIASNLSYKYGEKTVFSSLSFIINKGDKIAIIGANGSGKTTLLKLLSGLINEYEGQLKINGIEFKEVSLESLRSLLSYVEQDSYIFNGNIEENILVNNYNSCKEFDEIITEFHIDYLQRKEISENGKELSGGEKKKISIARAILRNRDIIIMDEPTCNLDTETIHWLEKMIQNSNKTIIYVTHDSIISGTNTVITL